MGTKKRKRPPHRCAGMNRLPPALTVANKGQRKGEGGRGEGGRGWLKRQRVCFLASSVAAGKDNRSRIPVQTSPETPQSRRVQVEHAHTNAGAQAAPASEGNVSSPLTV